MLYMYMYICVYIGKKTSNIPYTSIYIVYICLSVYRYFCYINIWMFPKIGVPQNGWFLMENPITMG